MSKTHKILESPLIQGYNLLHDGVVLLDSEGTILWMNDAAEVMWGYLREEILFSKATKLFPNCSLDMQGEVEIKRKRGELRTVWAESETLQWEGEQFHILVLQDMLDLLNMEKSLKKYQELQMAVTKVQSKYISSGIHQSLDELFNPLLRSLQIVCGADGALLFMLEEDKCFYVAHSSEHKPESIEVLLPYLDKEKKVISGLNLSLGPYTVENLFVYFFKESNFCLVLFNCDEVLEESGGLESVAETIKQIMVSISVGKKKEEVQNELNENQSALKALAKKLVYQNQELTHAKEEAEKANKTQKAFLANVSHELRTPLNGIMGTCELILCMDLSEKIQKHATTIYQSSETLLSLVNDLLDYSKIEAGEVKIDYVSCDLCKLIQETIKLKQPKAHKKNVRIYFYYPKDLPFEVMTDPVRVRELVSNLLSNAIKFTKEGYILVQCQKKQQKEGEVEIEISVSDTGEGIDPEFEKHLFQRFSQADFSSTKKYQGTGLGLAICKLLVDKLHGKIGFASKPGQGSTFFFTLSYPLLSQHTEDYFCEGKRAMILEPKEIRRFILASYCKSLGIEVSCLSEEKSVKDGEVDLVLRSDESPLSAFDIYKKVREENHE